MTIGKYAGLQQMGHKSWYTNGKTWQVSFMAFQQFKEKAMLNGMPQLDKIDTLVVNTFSDIPNDAESLRKYRAASYDSRTFTLPTADRKTSRYTTPSRTRIRTAPLLTAKATPASYVRADTPLGANAVCP